MSLALATGACDSASDTGDGGLPDGEVDAGQGDGDFDPGDFDGWTLNFPSGLSFCGWNAMQGLSPPYAPFDHRIRLDVTGASVRWPRDLEIMEIDLLDRVEVGPDGAEATAAGGGQLRTYVSSEGQNTWVIFGYTQDYQSGGNPLQASFGFHLENPGDTGTYNVADLLAGEQNTCSLHPDQTEGLVTATTVGGDVIVFDYRYILSFSCPPGMICLTPYGLGDPYRGSFTRGGDERVVTSYFRLGLDCMHHGGPERFIMIFDQPLDNVHGLVLAPNMMGGMQYEVTYLDSDLDAAGTEDVTDLTWDDSGRQE